MSTHYSEADEEESHAFFAAVAGMVYLAAVVLLLFSRLFWMMGATGTYDYDKAVSANRFYNEVNTGTLVGSEPQDVLAGDLHRALLNSAVSDRVATLSKFKAPQKADVSKTSIYSGATSNTGISLFSEDSDTGALTADTQSKVLAAYNGQLSSLLVKVGEKPEGHHFWPTNHTLLVYFAIVSTLALIIATLAVYISEEVEPGAISWRINGVSTTLKAVTGLMVPLLGAILLVSFVINTLLLPCKTFTAWVGTRVTAHRQYKLDLAKAAQGSTVPENLDPFLRSPFIQAQQAVTRLTVLASENPDSQDIKAALVRAQEVVGSMLLGSREAGTSDAEAEALRLVQNVEGLTAYGQEVMIDAAARKHSARN